MRRSTCNVPPLLPRPLWSLGLLLSWWSDPIGVVQTSLRRHPTRPGITLALASHPRHRSTAAGGHLVRSATGLGWKTRIPQILGTRDGCDDVYIMSGDAVSRE